MIESTKQHSLHTTTAVPSILLHYGSAVDCNYPTSLSFHKLAKSQTLNIHGDITQLWHIPKFISKHSLLPPSTFTQALLPLQELSTAFRSFPCKSESQNYPKHIPIIFILCLFKTHWYCILFFFFRTFSTNYICANIVFLRAIIFMRPLMQNSSIKQKHVILPCKSVGLESLASIALYICALCSVAAQCNYAEC